MIRDILPEDKGVFMSMAKSFYSSSAVSHNIDFVNFEVTFAAAMDKSPFIRVLIFEDDGKPVGYALLSFTFSNEAGGMAVLIEELYIEKGCRGKGIAKNFFEFLEREYGSAKRFRLEVMKDNERAIKLYRKLGYETLEYVQMIKDRL